jgi:hypothetical protein
MKSRDVAVATMTRPRDVDEERLISRALNRLSNHAMPIAVGDGGSSRQFVDEMRQLPGLTVIQAKHDGLVAQVQASVLKAHATGRESFCIRSQTSTPSSIAPLGISFGWHPKTRESCLRADPRWDSRHSLPFSVPPNPQRTSCAAPLPVP